MWWQCTRNEHSIDSWQCSTLFICSKITYRCLLSRIFLVLFAIVSTVLCSWPRSLKIHWRTIIRILFAISFTHGLNKILSVKSELSSSSNHSYLSTCIPLRSHEAVFRITRTTRQVFTIFPISFTRYSSNVWSPRIHIDSNIFRSYPFSLQLNFFLNSTFSLLVIGAYMDEIF